MAAPLIVAAFAGRAYGATLLSQTAGAVVSWAVSSAANAMLAPISRVRAYRMNSEFPISMMPDTGDILRLYHANKLQAGERDLLLSYHGIVDAGEDEGGAASKSWRGVIDLASTQLGLDSYADLWRQGYITDDVYTSKMVRAGISSVDNRGYLLELSQSYPVPEALSFRNQGFVDDAELKYALKRAGYKADARQSPYLAQRPALTLDQLRDGWWIGTIGPADAKRHGDMLGYAGDIPDIAGAFPGLQGAAERQIDIPARLYEQLATERAYTEEETLALFYRQEIPLDTARNHIAAQGIVGVMRQDEWLRSRRPIPGPTDLERFAVRDVWDPQVVQRFEYDAEYPVPFDFWMRQVGYGWGADQVVPGVQPGQQTDWARAYWRAHWATMSPSMAFECYHRLRPNRIANYQATVPGVQPFTFQDVLTVLKVADYPAPVRQWLAAISHSIVDIRMLRLGYQFGLIPRADFVEHAMDRGYTPGDSELQAQIEDARAEYLANSSIRRIRNNAPGQVVRTILAAYALGTITETEVRARFDALDIGPTAINQLIAVATANNSLGTVKAGLKALRRGFMLGEFAANELPARIAALGIVPGAIARYVNTWTFERSFQRRQLSTQQILRYVCDGLLSAPDATNRLVNLGWSAPDVLVMMASADHCLATAQGKAIAAQERAAAKRAHELEAAQAKLLAGAKKIQADLKALTPLATLKKWLLANVVSQAYVRARLLAMGYPIDIANGYIYEWLGGSGAAPIPPPPPPPQTPPKPPGAGGPQSLTAQTTDLTAG